MTCYTNLRSVVLVLYCVVCIYVPFVFVYTLNFVIFMVGDFCLYLWVIKIQKNLTRRVKACALKL